MREQSRPHRMRRPGTPPAVLKPGRREREMSEEPILSIKPSHWNYFWFYVFGWLVIPLIIALARRASVTFHLYPGWLVMERGVLSKSYQKLFCDDIRTISVRQSLLQRIFGIGDLLIATSGDKWEATIRGVPDPERIQTLVMDQKQMHQDGTRTEFAAPPV